METNTENVWKKCLLSALVLSLGCGSDDDSAKPKCEKLVRTYCDRVVSCAEQDELIEASEADALHSDCVDALTEDSLDCSEADEVSSDYGACLAQTQALDCAAANAALLVGDLVEPPTVCDGTILFAE